MSQWDIRCEEISYSTNMEDVLRYDFGLTDEEVEEFMAEYFGA